MSKPLEIEGMVQLVLDKVLGCRSPGPSRAVSWLFLVQASCSWVRDPPSPLSPDLDKTLKLIAMHYF